MRTIVLFSGGFDSTVVLHLALKRYKNVSALGVDYGQRHLIELRRAEEIAAHAGAAFERVSVMFPWSGNLAKESGSLANPVLEGRNMLLLLVAATASPDVGRVCIGCCAADAAVFPDCSPAFLACARRVLLTGLGRHVQVEAPLLSSSKLDALAMARELGCEDAVRRSWSCYDPQGIDPCGVCMACQHRADWEAALG